MKALLIGATGLVGNELLHQLLNNPRFTNVVIFVRHSAGLTHPKLTEHIINFEKIEEIKELIKGDVLFSALGTTIKTAGTKEAQYRVDHNYQYQFARIAAENNISTYILVSAAGANENSNLFYNRMKGELERDIMKLSINRVCFIRPGLLTGNRSESRAGEKFAYVILKAINALGILKKYKPIHAAVVARAMVNALLENKPGITVYELDEVFTLSEKTI